MLGYSPRNLHAKEQRMACCSAGWPAGRYKPPKRSLSGIRCVCKSMYAPLPLHRLMKSFVLFAGKMAVRRPSAGRPALLGVRRDRAVWYKPASLLWTTSSANRVAGGVTADRLHGSYRPISRTISGPCRIASLRTYGLGATAVPLLPYSRVLGYDGLVERTWHHDDPRHRSSAPSGHLQPSRCS